MNRNLTTEIPALLASQRAFWAAGQTRSLEWRLTALKKLKAAILRSEPDLIAALETDLRKPRLESYTSELGMIVTEINYALANLKKWIRPQRVKANLLTFPAKSYLLKEPYGVVLIIAPWNYPVQLALSPLVGAIAAGNCCILKPSELAPATAAAVAQLVDATFNSEFIKVVTGDAATSQCLLEQHFDKIFFTGSPRVGKIVMEQAARQLTPVTLELGGKSPCIVDRNVNLEIAAKRIVWGKFFNAGQTCVAPDYLLARREIKEPLCQAMQRWIERFFGSNPENSPDLAKIINGRHFDRLIAYLQDAQIICGGHWDAERLYIEPTLIEAADQDAPVMQEEIFGPILPVVTYTRIDEVLNLINRHPDPLACYIFSNDRQVTEQLLNSIPFGGGCVNDTLSHFLNPRLPFGGRGASGIGNYHGHYSFEAFSHSKAVVKTGFRFDLPVKYPPYRENHRLLRKFLLK
ncbi:MAG: aldehyde dehydrogenase [Bacillota bacterium]|jgi:aldehyde dehydrogenase (NAD+)